MRNLVVGSLLALVATLAGAQGTCAWRLFVSGYYSNVHVYDACSGEYVRDLDVPGRIRGAQAVTLGPDGKLYVVSEQTSEILRYRGDTLAFDGVLARIPGIEPTSVAFGADGLLYVSGYGSHDVRTFDLAGTPVKVVVAPHAAGLSGPDIGMRFINGALYVPGYDSSTVVRYDPANGSTAVALAPRAGGMLHPRSVLGSRDGTAMYVTAEGSSQVLRHVFATGAVTELAHVGKAQGIDYSPEGDLLVGTNDSVIRLDAVTGEVRGTLVARGAGGVAGLTYVAVIPVAPPPAAVRVVEFYNAALDHYFISSLAADIAALDGGTLHGWARTGLGFGAFAAARAGTSPVCRFYLPPGRGDSHFYSASPAECDAVAARFPAFVYETPAVFHVALPDTATGACPAGTAPVYRLWNGRADSNHRYTTDAEVKARMVARGYVPEGYGPDAAIMCATT